MNQTIGNVGTNTFKKDTPRKWNQKNLVIAGIAFVVIVILAWGIYKFFFAKEKYTYANFTDTEAFFLSNAEGNYALFNEDGKQLTDFIFDDIDTFYGGAARVKTVDGDYGIVKEDGKFLVAPTKDRIGDYGALYELTDSSMKSRVVNYQGKSVIEGYGISIHKFSDSAIYYISSLATENGTEPTEVKVVNYKGKVMDTIPNTDYFATDYVKEKYTSLSDGTVTYVYNIDKGKRVAKVDGSYCVQSAVGNHILLTSCGTLYHKDETNNYALLEKGKLKYTISKEQCSAALTTDGGVMCADSGYNYHLVDGKGTVSSEKIETYIDSKNYIVEGDDGNYIFYANGKKAQTVSCIQSWHKLENGYIIEKKGYDNCGEEAGYAYYNTKGEKKSKYYDVAGAWDTNGLAIVADDVFQYYLINQKFKQVSEVYQSIQNIGNLYVVTQDSKDMLIQKNGKVLEDDINTVKSGLRKEQPYLAAKKGDSFLVYDATSGKKVGEYKGNSIRFYDHYFTVDNTYYSYRNGKSFYTVNS